MLIACKECLRVLDDSIDTIYPHNMTEEQWRNHSALELAKHTGGEAEVLVTEKFAKYYFELADAMIAESKKHIDKTP